MKPMKYKGYLGSIDVDETEGVFYGEVLFINDSIAYEGQTYPELKKAFEDEIEKYLQFCKQIGKEPDKPFSGTWNIRTSPEVHKKLAVRASLLGCSLNSLVSEILSEATKQFDNKLNSRPLEYDGEDVQSNLPKRTFQMLKMHGRYLDSKFKERLVN